MIVEISKERAAELAEKIARFIVERKMASAAILTIESLKPLNYIGSQFLYAIAPFAEVIFNPKEYQEFAAMLEREENINLLLRRIDELDYEFHNEERKRKRLLKKRRANKFKAIIHGLTKRKK